ncbi:MAG: hypothetical protein JOZ99_05860 [Actinobacteria bacterium]|nr:hypothetical protein [Actinomycetota bacterium]
MHAVVDVLLVAAGALLVVVVLDAAVRTFVVPRGVAVLYSRLVFGVVRRGFNLVASRVDTYEARDRVMTIYAPFTLVLLPFTWLVVVVAGFMLMLHGFGVRGWLESFDASGSSVLTLGFVRPHDFPGMALSFTEAATGLFLLTLLIAYLPTIYSAFSRREVLVAHLTARAGSPPSAYDLLRRAFLIEKLHDLDDLWVSWQLWFGELEETHTSLGALTFFRSPKPDRSWVTAAGVVLDAAALVNSTIEGPWQPAAALCVRSGFTALRSIADFFDIDSDHDPAPTDPISIAREEWEDVCRQLTAVGVPLKEDRDQAWRDFAGWRVNYDVVLIALAGLTMAPYAMWSSDRSVYRPTPLIPRASRPRWIRRLAATRRTASARAPMGGRRGE